MQDRARPKEKKVSFCTISTTRGLLESRKSLSYYYFPNSPRCHFFSVHSVGTAITNVVISVKSLLRGGKGAGEGKKGEKGVSPWCSCLLMGAGSEVFRGKEERDGKRDCESFHSFFLTWVGG